MNRIIIILYIFFGTLSIVEGQPYSQKIPKSKSISEDLTKTASGEKANNTSSGASVILIVSDLKLSDQLKGMIGMIQIVAINGMLISNSIRRDPKFKK